jgi:ADP-ribose pyrophosphatase
MNQAFEILNQEIAYNGFFKLETYYFRHTLFKGGWSEPVKRELFRRNNCVAVLLYDPNLDRIVLIEQFRVGAMLHQRNAWLLEIVAGGIEDGETAEEVAYREAKEEANCDIQALMPISEFYTSPGGASERLSLFCGKIDSSNVGGIYGLAEENEDIAVTTVSFDEAMTLVNQGRIESAIPIIALQWLALNHQQIRQHWQN